MNESGSPPPTNRCSILQGNALRRMFVFALWHTTIFVNDGKFKTEWRFLRKE
jgi:hypothetical protein